MKRFVLLLSLLGAVFMLAGCVSWYTSATIIPYTGDVPAEKLCTLNIEEAITVQTLDGHPVTWARKKSDDWVQVRVPAGTHTFVFDYRHTSLQGAGYPTRTVWSKKPLMFSYNFLAGREYSILARDQPAMTGTHEPLRIVDIGVFIKDATGQPHLGVTNFMPLTGGWEKVPVYITEDVSGGKDRAADLRGAAEKGVAQAQNNLGVMYREGKGVAKDDKEAVAWFRRAADQDIAQAQFNLGLMYYNGDGVAKDDKEAMAWYRRAADQGYAPAQFNLGLMYYKDEGVAKDDKEAAAWFRRAADQGHAGAQNDLGVMYREGEGVAKDYKEAVTWFRRAADQGLAGAQFNLGLMYDKGEGVAKDGKEAAAWYRKAADQGDADARAALQRLQ